jgi:hypothetical protein
MIGLIVPGSGIRHIHFEWVSVFGSRITHPGSRYDHPHHDPRERPLSQRHEHARAGDGIGEFSRDRVRDRVERRYRNGDLDEAPRRLIGCGGRRGAGELTAEED